MDRRERVKLLLDHAENPRHRGVLRDADVVMPGGSPECGGSVVVYLKGEAGEGGRITGLSFTGEGDTISQGATSILLERVHDEDLAMDDVLALDYEAFVDAVGREVVGRRTRHATLGLSTLKAAIRKYRRYSLQDGTAVERPAAGTRPA